MEGRRQLCAGISGTSVGVGLRSPHIPDVLANRPSIDWFEIHAENYFGAGTATDQLMRIRRDYPVSLHGVGLSLGSATPLNATHLQNLADLAARLEPVLISEHLTWSWGNDAYLNDLLPLPLTEETLRIVCGNVERTQDALGRSILIENPSSYVRFSHSTIAEASFLNDLARRTGCGVLCDVNNVYVTSWNFGLNPLEFLMTLDPSIVREIHLAGHQRSERGGVTLLIDDHGAPVSPEVWRLYEVAIRRFGRVPTLVEWDRSLPPLPVLLAEARRAAAHAAALTQTTSERCHAWLA